MDGAGDSKAKWKQGQDWTGHSGIPSKRRASLSDAVPRGNTGDWLRMGLAQPDQPGNMRHHAFAQSAQAVTAFEH